MTTTTMTMVEMVERMFAEIASDMGYTTWWDAEEAWDTIATQMVARGCDADAVADLLADMAADL